MAGEAAEAVDHTFKDKHDVTAGEVLGVGEVEEHEEHCSGEGYAAASCDRCCGWPAAAHTATRRCWRRLGEAAVLKPCVQTAKSPRLTSGEKGKSLWKAKKSMKGLSVMRQ